MSSFTVKSIAATLLTAFVSAVVFGAGVSAADARNFNAGRIIDDGVFTNSSSMSVADIQNFLNSKVTCDTWGTKPSELGGGTRAQWMAARGISPPFRCVTDYRENPSTRENNYGKSSAPAGSISAAEIIYNYSRQFNINPQVIIVTLQKENGLITDAWPTPKQFSESMGFGCPDNVAPGAPACDPSYGSFSAQVYQAARHFRGYIDSPAGWWIPFTTGWNSIAWSPNSSCGRGDVYIENRATVALYSYTPYQPNQAAKNAQYGTGDGCSAYGNRNFYMYFTDWFGSVYDSISTSGLQITRDGAGQIFTDKPVTVSFTLTNRTKASYSYRYVGVAVRGPSGQNYDPGWASNVTIRPGESYTYSKTITPTIEGGYTMYISSYAEQDDAWRECFLDKTQSTCYTPKIIQKPIEIVATPAIKRAATNQDIDMLRQNQAFKVEYTLKNTSATYPAVAGNVMVAGRSADGKNRDMRMLSAGTLTPSQTYTYSDTQTLNDAPGTSYTFYVSTTKDSGKTYEEQAFAASNGVAQQKNATLKQGVSLIEGPTVVSGQYVGGDVTVRMKIKNNTDAPVDLGRVGIVVRGPNGENRDPGWQRVDAVPSSGDGIYTYQATFKPTVSGNWNIAYMNTATNYSWWNDTYPASEDSQVKRSTNITIKDATTLIQGPVVTGGVLHVGAKAEVTMKVKTVSADPIDVGRIGVTVRGPNGQNRDPLWERVDNLSAGTNGGVHTYKATFIPDAEGVWDIGYMYASADFSTWDSLRIKSEDGTVQRSIKVTAKPQAAIVSGITVSGVALGARQAQVTIKNYGDTEIDLGKVGLAVRDPQGANRDAWWEDFKVPAHSERTHTVGVNFTKAGAWTFEVFSYKNGTWSNKAIKPEPTAQQWIKVTAH